jgi:type IV pilus assembly protein PilY1
MEYSIPARIKPIDVDGDGYVDRLYAGDMGGQLWRIDIDNVANTASSISATGGRIADLADDNDVNENRRFYYPPDVALIIQEGQAPFVSVVAASGFRAHPLNDDVHDRFYMIRDYDIYSVPSSYVTVTEDDLFDTTSNVIGEGTDTQIASAMTSLSSAQGWYISLNQLDGSWIGEKSLAEPLILNGTAIVTTYMPADTSGVQAASCTPNDGTGSLFFVNVTDGTPTYDLSGDDTKSREDRKIFLDRGGIPPSPTVIITEGGTPTLCVGTECERAGDIGSIQKMYWYEVEE